VAAHRLVRRAGALGVQGAVLEALFRAYFQDGEDIGDAAVLARIGEAAGVPDAAAFLAGDDEADAVRAEDAGFRRMGISGVPSFALDRHLLFSGAMAPEQMAAAFRRGAALLAEQARVRSA
jgi:predicted DsbA family dithiol-disulfide isomerase